MKNRGVLELCRRLLDEAESTKDCETAFNKADLAASLLREHNEKQPEIAALNCCVKYLKNLHQYNKAIEYQRRALELRRMLNDAKLTFRCLVILGDLYLQMNRLDEAIETLEEAYKCNEFEMNYKLRCLNTLFVAYQRCGYTDRAKVIVEEFGQIVASHGSDVDKAVYFMLLAAIEKSVTRNVELIQKALQTVTPQSRLHASILNNLASKLIEQGNFKAAKDAVLQAQAMVTEEHTTYGMIMINMSMISIAYNDYRGARATLETAFAFYEKLIQENKPIGCAWKMLSDTLIYMGDFEIDSGNPHKAMACYEKAGTQQATLRIMCVNGSAIKQAVREFMLMRHDDDTTGYVITLLRVSSYLEHRDAVDVVEEACLVAEKSFGVCSRLTFGCKFKLAALKKPREAELLFEEMEKCIAQFSEEQVAEFHLNRGLIMKNVDDLRIALQFFGDDANSPQIQEARKLLK